jgi:hypothetical protein
VALEYNGRGIASDTRFYYTFHSIQQHSWRRAFLMMAHVCFCIFQHLWRDESLDFL